MESSILKSVKKVLGIHENFKEFDTDILIHINTASSILVQLGAFEKPVEITDEDDEWDDYINPEKNMSMVKSYMCLKTRYLFDPPQSSQVAEAMVKNLAELEWRISVQNDLNKE